MNARPVSASLAAAAAARIEAGALDAGTLEDLARELRVSSRHLRRAMRAELGVTPIDYAQACRLARARRLVRTSRRPITSVAFESGFRSLRRFNALFSATHACSPTALRRRRKETPETLSLRIEHRAARDWPSTLRSLAARAVPGVELVEGVTYARTERVGDARGWLAAYPDASGRALTVELSLSLAEALVPVVTRLKRLLGEG